MRIRDLNKKINVKNIIVMILILVTHLIGLFSSPFYLGVNYSKKVLIDDYCKSNGDGNALILKSNLKHELLSYEKIKEFKNVYDSEYNTILGVSTSNAMLNGKECHLVGTTQSETNVNYNKFRNYSENAWGNIQSGDYIFIPESMVSEFVTDPDDILNTEVDIVINGKSHTFKIGGVYIDSLSGGGWNSRGKYFNNVFSRCIFINESFLEKEYNCVFEMITSDTDESGVIYDKYLDFVTQNKGSILQSKFFRENKLLGDLTTLARTGRNKIAQVLVILFSSLFFVATLIVAIKLFSIDSVNIKKRRAHLFGWNLFYYALSCLFILIVRNRFFTLFGFTAYGGNKALLNILIIFFVLFFIATVFKTYIIYKKEQAFTKNKKDKTVNKSIIFITKAKFPSDNAFATYIGGIASVYKKAGNDVICIGNGNTKRNEILESYFGKYVSVRNKGSSFISKVLSQLLFESRVYRFLKNNYENPSHIFFSCEFSIYFCNKIKKLYSDNNINYSFIITEEFTKDEFEKYSILSKRSLYINHYYIDKYQSDDDSFIAISKYLQNKFLDKKMKCIYVPFSFNFDYVSFIKEKPLEHTKINYVYCGSPENKDLLPTIINAFSGLGDRDYKKDIHLDVIGVDEKWAFEHGVTSYDKNIITFHGRQSRDFIISKYSECDYSVLLRDEEKIFAKAGFPTKISESMAFGIVPITNPTSNLSDYLNNSNSVIVNGHGVADFINAIDISIKEKSKLSSRKKAALSTASLHFNVESYSKELLALVKK